MSTPVARSATLLGGPIEANNDPAIFFRSQPLPAPVFASPATTPPPVTTSTTLSPGAGGGAPSLTTTRTATVTDLDTGVGATVSGTGTAPNFAPNSVEFGVPLIDEGGAQIRVIGGVRTSGFVTGVGATLAGDEFKLDVGWRRLTPAGFDTEGTDLYAGGVTVGRDLRFTAGVAVTDAPGLGGDSTTYSATLTAPLGNGWTGSASGRVVARPGEDNDTVGGGLQFGNGDFSLQADVNQTGNETVGTVRFGVNF
jgi:hypothetical protein